MLSGQGEREGGGGSERSVGQPVGAWHRDA